MGKECIYVANTPLGNCCTLTNEECINPYIDECDEPEWSYLMELAEEHKEDDTGTVQVGRTNIRFV